MKKIFVLKQSFVLSAALLFFTHCIQAQNIFPSTGNAGIGTTSPFASAALEIKSTTEGILIPRMTRTQRDLILVSTAAKGLLIYQTTNTPGFYYYDGSLWTAVTPKANGWSLTGNSGTISGTNFIGTTDAKPLVFKVNNQKAGYLGTTTNTAFGYQTLNTNTSGVDNTASGFQALYVNRTGHDNTATGGYSLYSNSNGIGNTANGISALRFNTHGNDNTAIGANTLFYNATGYSNVAVGTNALFKNTTSSNSVAVGDSALYNQNGEYGFNTAVGSKALYSDTTGYHNIAIGFEALYSNTNGRENTASGYGAMYSNTTGTGNTALGSAALANNLDGIGNTAIGMFAFQSVGGSANTAIGYSSDANNSFDESSAFGAYALVTASNQVRIGDDFTISIGGYQDWTNLSDGRVKKNIKENVPGLAFINLLKPITYNLDLDAADKIVQRPVVKDKNGKTIQPSPEQMNARNVRQKIVCTGFIAQDVEATAKKIGYDFDGVDAAKNDKDLYGLRYSEFVVPLVKAVQELSSQNEKLKKQNEEQQQINNDLQNRLAKLEAMINVHQSTTNLSSASLDQNVPNPFSNTTTISYSLPQHFASAQIIITDKAGKVLKQVNLPAGRQGVSGSGKGSVNVNAATLAAGAYQYSLLIDGKLIDTKQMVLTK